jgi:hypothetical protein
VRPLFLSRITRRPSLRFALRNLCGRVMRRVRGIERPPVQLITERDLRLADIALAYTAGLCTMGFVTLVLITFVWRPVC